MKISAGAIVTCAALASGGLLIAALASSGARSSGAAEAAESSKPARGEVLIARAGAGDTHRSPVDLALAADGSWLVTANETTGTITLVRTRDGKLLDEVACGARPVAVERVGEEGVLVSSADDGLVSSYKIFGEKLVRRGEFRTGYQPHGIAVSADGKRAFVGLVATGQVAELDLGGEDANEDVEGKIARTIDVGPWPRYLTLSPDGSRLAVACSGASNVVVVDTAAGKVLYDEPLSGGINLGHMQPSADGKYAYFPWMIYRINPINPHNIRQGWVLASRIGRVRLDGASYREAISLDVPGLAVADPHGLAINADESRLVVAASGTRELLVYRLADLPFIGAGGPGDLIDEKLLRDRDLFYRIPLQGRPMGATFAPDNRTVYVANYLRDSVQVVDIVEKKITAEIALGGPKEASLARRGEEIFYDGRHSLDQWYSCHTCHYNGGTNAKAMDTWNDGTPLTTKTVLPLYHVGRTAPWTWHGWQESLADSVQNSFTSTMQGKGVSDEQAEAVIAYLDTLELPPNPFLSDAKLSAAALRGKLVFENAKAGCIQCHKGEDFTDNEIHDVGLGSEKDKYQGYNTPSLRGAYARVRYLHDGRAKTLEALLTGPHAPEKVAGEGKLSEAELGNLIEYLKSL